MPYTRLEIDTIHQRGQAVPGRRYKTFDGETYIGTSKKRLRLLEGALRALEKTVENTDTTTETPTTSTGDDKHFEFTQGVASDTWEVQHNLDKYPSVMVVDTGNNEVLGCTQHIDKNKLIITFGNPFTGKAYLN